MSQEGQQGGNSQSATQTDNWSAIESAYGQQSAGGPPSATTTATQTQTDPPQQQQADQTQNQSQQQDQQQNQSQSQSTENKSADGTQKTGDNQTKAGDQQQQQQPVLTLTADDVKKADLPAEAGTWLKRFQDQKLDIPQDFAEDKGADLFVSAMAKNADARIQEAKSIGMEKVFETLKPETATKLKLMEMGLTEEQIFQPTRELDGYIALEDPALCRAELVAIGYPADVVEAKMEALAADPAKLKTFANEVRFTLNQQKQGIQTQQETLVQQYEARRAQVQAAQQQERVTNFTKALDTVSEFMGAPIAKEAKELVAKKYQSGAYKDSLGTPASEVELVLYREFGEKIKNIIRNTAYEKGRDEIKKDLSNVPPVKQNTGQRTIANNNDDNWSAVERAMGYK